MMAQHWSVTSRVSQSIIRLIDVNASTVMKVVAQSRCSLNKISIDARTRSRYCVIMETGGRGGWAAGVEGGSGKAVDGREGGRGEGEEKNEKRTNERVNGRRW